MIALGIETSYDETSISLLKDGKKLLSNVTVSSLKEHEKYGGVVPEIEAAGVEFVLAKDLVE